MLGCGGLFAQTPVPDTVLIDRNVEYSAVGGRQLMDIVRPRDLATNPRPAVLLVVRKNLIRLRPPSPGNTRGGVRLDLAARSAMAFENSRPSDADERRAM